MRYLSIFNNDGEILTAFSDIFLKGEWFDLDCTFSKGVFYEKIEHPKIKSDLFPLYEDVIQANSTNLEFIEDNSIKSIVFDPPFLFRNRKSANNDKISARFSYFKTYEELIDMYKKSIDCFYRKLKKGGFVFFKCQDMTDNKFFCTHKDIIDYATQNGFILKDIGIKASKVKLQRDAKQQNCLGKVHSYWLVFKKVSKRNGG